MLDGLREELDEMASGSFAELTDMEHISVANAYVDKIGNFQAQKVSEWRTLMHASSLKVEEVVSKMTALKDNIKRNRDNYTVEEIGTMMIPFKLSQV